MKTEILVAILHFFCIRQMMFLLLDQAVTAVQSGSSGKPRRPYWVLAGHTNVPKPPADHKEHACLYSVLRRNLTERHFQEAELKISSYR